MKPQELQEATHVAVEGFTNSLGCKSEAEVLLALKSLIAMAVSAHNMVSTGNKVVVQ